MNSLTVETIMSILTRDKQIELFGALAKELHRTQPNSLHDIYTVVLNNRSPTGGDWCDHDCFIIITGDYDEAKRCYDQHTINKTVEYGDYTETYFLMKGDTTLDSTCYDATQTTVTNKKHVDGEQDGYPKYEIKYPLYNVVCEEDYDTICSLGLCDDFDKAKEAFLNKISSSILGEDERRDFYGMKLKIFLMNEQDIKNGKDGLMVLDFNKHNFNQ